MPAIYTKAAMIERLKKHMVNNFPNDDFSITDNEMLLYIDSAVATSMINNVFGLAKIEGAICTPEAWYVTSSLTLTQNEISGTWDGVLPQPPVSLPLGYSISDVYFGSYANSRSQTVFPIEAKRAAYRSFQPSLGGCRYTVENKIIKVTTPNGVPLINETLYVTMISTRTSDKNDTLNMPDDALDGIFDSVVKRLAQRFGFPQDVVEDSLPSGNKTS